MTTIDAIRDDLAKIVDQAMWAHGIGYSKAGRGLDAEHGADLSRSEQEREAGPTYDLEIGDHAARVAYQAAVRAVSRADVLVAGRLYQDGVTTQLPVDPLTSYALPFYLRRTAHRLSWRLTRLDPESHKATLHVIRSSFDRVVRGFAKALDEGSMVYSAHKESNCVTCTIREREVKKSECSTCAKYRARKGIARPKDRDRNERGELLAAKARRQARGEDYGVA